MEMIWMILLLFPFIKCQFTTFNIADWGKVTKCQSDVIKGMLKLCDTLNPQFIIAAGDNFYESGVDSINDTNWERILEKPFSKLPSYLKLHSCLGDHDWRKNPKAQVDYTDSPLNKRWKMNGYWWYEVINFKSSSKFSDIIKAAGLKHNDQLHIRREFSNLRSNSINNNFSDFIYSNNTKSHINETNIKDFEGNSEIDSSSKEDVTAVFIYLDSWVLARDSFKKTPKNFRYLQLNFLERVLRACISKQVDWIIIVNHYSLYSSGIMHGPHIKLRNILLPLLKKYKVDLFISGHDHHIELIEPEDHTTQYHVVGGGCCPREGFCEIEKDSIYRLDSCGFETLTLGKSIAISRYFNKYLNLFNSVQYSSKKLRDLMEIESEEFPPQETSEQIRQPLIRISGWGILI
ncbi:serine threonine protein phosphatase [Cryptosporidium andersoni]|uniref:acid phosphatase n=1 Tax=Cryptosporidium andersoni TaxID=117008 RepID=A0A1J4MNU4_9CRYT|nr:serine threonine protein phosphatase [Cryptosporidium andersoni]